MMRHAIALLAFGMTIVGPTAARADAAYPLDKLSRVVPETGDLDCSRIEIAVEMAAYRGDVLRYQREVWVNAAFRERLVAFERVARDVGIEVYGRPPERILSLGGYGCRRTREHPGLLSEHALGNAIDVAGFDFGHLPKGATLPAGLDPVFANGFGVRVVSDWGKKNGFAKVHALFLRTLVKRLLPRDPRGDVFRVILGPGFPGHANHLHFDMSPVGRVAVFEDGVLLTP